MIRIQRRVVHDDFRPDVASRGYLRPIRPRNPVAVVKYTAAAAALHWEQNHSSRTAVQEAPPLPQLTVNVFLLSPRPHRRHFCKVVTGRSVPILP
uniref:Uncharacterized protein n=1 Tax=Arundo donax TaxID=35708 RepID=A0A0A9A1B8_ARUDO